MTFRFLFVVWVGVLLPMCSIGAETPAKAITFHRSGRAFLPEQGCSFVVGKGWEKQSEENSTILVAKADNGQQANIIVSSWKTPGTIQQFAGDAASKMEPNGYKVAKPEAFSTFAKLEGLRLRAKASDGRRVGIQYLFPAGDGRILTATGTFDEKANADFEHVMELSMKTLHLLDRPHNLRLETGTRFGDKRASLAVPLGWDVNADATMTTAFGPPVVHHHEQLFVNFDPSPLPLEEFVRREADSDGPAGMKVEKEEEFVAPEVGKGFKVRGRMQGADETELRMATYYFDGADGKKIVIGASTDAALWPAMEPLFDACVKTLRVGAPAKQPSAPEPKK